MPSKFSRRRFLESVGIVCATASFAGCSSLSGDETPSDTAPASNPTGRSPSTSPTSTPTTTLTPTRNTPLTTPTPSGTDTTTPAQSTQASQITATDGDTDDEFGYTVAVSGDGSTAIVGASGDKGPNGNRAGSVYVFSATGTSWVQEAKLTPGNGQTGDKFGRAVAVSEDGSTTIVGANDDDNLNGENAGSAYVFSRTDDSWTQEAKLTAGDGGAGDWFGRAVAVASDGETALIGAPFDQQPNGEHAGSAYVFSKTGGSWSQEAKLAAEDGDSNDEYGSAVALSSDGSTALIGAPSDEDPNGSTAPTSSQVVDGGPGGSAYVCTRTDGSWSQKAKIAANDGDARDEFGNAVAVSGTTAVIGAPNDEDPNGPSSGIGGAGSAYVFSGADGSWSQETKLAANDGEPNDRFGESVGISDDASTIIVGAIFDDTSNGRNAGSAYKFSMQSGSWTQDAKLTVNNGESSDLFGGAVAVSATGATVLSGAFIDDTTNGTDTGAAYVFE